MAPPSEQFVSEAIRPIAGTFSTKAMARGEPGLPAGFVWRGQEFRIEAVIETWKSSGDCRSGVAAKRQGKPAERYLRRHWYRIQLPAGETWTIYFERQPRPTSSKTATKQRWFLYTITKK